MHPDHLRWVEGELEQFVDNDESLEATRRRLSGHCTEQRARDFWTFAAGRYMALYTAEQARNNGLDAATFDEPIDNLSARLVAGEI